MHRPFLLTAFLFLSMLLPGCKTHGVRESLDAETFVSVITAEPAMALYRHNLSGGYGRDFVSLGPVEVVASSDRGYFLWMSFWGTLPNGEYVVVDQPEQVVIRAGGERYELDRAVAGEGLLRLSQPAYDAPIHGSDSGYFAVDESMLVSLSEQTSLTLTVGDKEFLLWGDQRTALAALRDFVNEATAF